MHNIYVDNSCSVSKSQLDDFDLIETDFTPPSAPEATAGRRLDKKGATLPPNFDETVKSAIKTGSYSDISLRTKCRVIHALFGVRSVSACGSKSVQKNENGVKGASLVRSEILNGPNAGTLRSSLQGVALCSSPWVCPVCSPRIGIARAAAMEPQAAALTEQGFSAWLVTLTVSHSREERLSDLFDCFQKAWSSMTAGRSVSLLRTRCNGLEYVRGYDATYSRRNGWHLHFHLVFFFGPSGDGKKEAQWFVDRWIRNVKKQGRKVLRRAQDVRPAGNASAAAAYAMTLAGVAKHTDRHNHTKNDAPASFSTLAEATAASAKKGRAEGGLTSAELREAALSGDQHLSCVYEEFCRATKGRRAVLVSQGLSLQSEEDASQEEVSISLELAGYLRDEGIRLVDPDLPSVLAATLEFGKEGGQKLLQEYLGSPGPSGLWQEDKDNAKPWRVLSDDSSKRLRSHWNKLDKDIKSAKMRYEKQ